jgi:hypothetical protein
MPANHGKGPTRQERERRPGPPTAAHASLHRASPESCYKFQMAKIIEQWLLFKYVGGEFTPLSKPFKTKHLAEKERLKYAERERKTIGLGVIRIKR